MSCLKYTIASGRAGWSLRLRIQEQSKGLIITDLAHRNTSLRIPSSTQETFKKSALVPGIMLSSERSKE
jgi:hypothetical protein